MYIVKITAKTTGVKTPRKPRFSGNFNGLEDARRWINQHIHATETDAWRKLGMVQCNATATDHGAVLEITPALRMVRGLTIEYKIMEVE